MEDTQNTQETLDNVDVNTQPAREQDETSEAQTLDIDAIVAEAEERGYLRGRNERIEQMMATPEELSASQQGDNQSDILILNSFRSSIWER